jgi:hypothetical protein
MSKMKPESKSKLKVKPISVIMTKIIQELAIEQPTGIGCGTSGIIDTKSVKTYHSKRDSGRYSVDTSCVHGATMSEKVKYKLLQLLINHEFDICEVHILELIEWIYQRFKTLDYSMNYSWTNIGKYENDTILEITQTIIAANPLLMIIAQYRYRNNISSNEFNMRVIKTLLKYGCHFSFTYTLLTRRDSYANGVLTKAGMEMTQTDNLYAELFSRYAYQNGLTILALDDYTRPGQPILSDSPMLLRYSYIHRDFSTYSVYTGYKDSTGHTNLDIKLPTILFAKYGIDPYTYFDAHAHAHAHIDSGADASPNTYTTTLEFLQLNIQMADVQIIERTTEYTEYDLKMSKPKDQKRDRKDVIHNKNRLSSLILLAEKVKDNRCITMQEYREAIELLKQETRKQISRTCRAFIIDDIYKIIFGYLYWL